MGWVEDAVIRQADIASAPSYSSGGGGSMGWVAPAIMAGGTVAGAAIGGKGAKKAAEIQAKSTDKALDFSREQDAYARAQYENALRAWDAGRQSLLSKYGITGVPSVVAAQVPMSPGQPVGAVPRSGFSTQPAANAIPPMAPAEAVQSTGPTLADVIRSRGSLGSAFDWKGAGLA